MPLQDIKIPFPQAISSFGSGFVLEGDDYSGLDWQNPDIPKPTEAEVDAKLAEMQAEYDAQAYARQRQAEYPDMGSQLNKIYDDGLTKWKAEMVDPVKAKWPKDNSGPV
jgi:hypothetical protein